MSEEHIALPFQATVPGMPVTVARVERHDHRPNRRDREREGHRQTIPILQLPVPEPPPDGWEWIEAYRHWAR